MLPPLLKLFFVIDFPYQESIVNQLFLSKEKLNWDTCKVELLPDFVLKVSLVRFSDVLRQIAEEGETGRLVPRQLRNIFDLDVFPLPGRWRKSLKSFSQKFIQL